MGTILCKKKVVYLSSPCSFQCHVNFLFPQIGFEWVCLLKRCSMLCFVIVHHITLLISHMRETSLELPDRWHRLCPSWLKFYVFTVYLSFCLSLPLVCVSIYIHPPLVCELDGLLGSLAQEKLQQLKNKCSVKIKVRIWSFLPARGALDQWEELGFWVAVGECWGEYARNGHQNQN